MPFAIMFGSRNFRSLKNCGTEKVTSEMIRTSITHNLKKIHQHMSNLVLKMILNMIRKLKRTQVVTIDILKD